jgi:xylulokinase
LLEGREAIQKFRDFAGSPRPLRGFAMTDTMDHELALSGTSVPAARGLEASMAPRQPGGTGPLILGVDAGTTNTKAVVIDAAGRVIAAASEPTPIEYPQPEWAEYDGETLWRGSARAIRAALAQVPQPERVAGVAVASMAETAIPLDAAGRTTGPAIAWFDKRTRAEVAEIERWIGAERLFAISGLAPNPIFGLCKLLWHRRHRPDAFARTVKWLNVADFLAWRLCGEMATDYSLASRTFALDVSALAWSAEVLDAMQVDAALMAPLAASGRSLGTVSEEAAAATGLPRGCVVAVGGHDHVVGALAADALRPGVLLSSTGTTEAQLMGVAAPGRDPALGRAGFSQGVIVVDAPVWYAVGGLFTAGGAIDWFCRTLAGGADYATLIEEALAAPPGSLGAGFLPQLRLGTPPHPDAFARGAFFGLSTDITRGCLFRAVLEGIAADAQLCAQAMAALAKAPPPAAVRVIGGMTRNPLYLRIKASVGGRPITVVELPDAVAMGAALLAGIGAGVYAGLADAQGQMRREEYVVEPDPTVHALYERLVREVYAPAYSMLRPLHAAARGVLGTPAAGPRAHDGG